MERDQLLNQIHTVEKLAGGSKWQRLFHDPAKYLRAILLKEMIYPRQKKEWIKSARLFYGKQMKVALPAATDIYLTGGKSHPSEIRLAKFLIRHLMPGDYFLDIGAHYGYFTLLASELIGEGGSVRSYEPGSASFCLLEDNCAVLSNVKVFAQALSDVPGTITFYEFPNRYSEYNSTDVRQFKNERWFSAFQPKKREVAATTIDAITQADGWIPKIIKIDVEGAEYKVLQGASGLLTHHAPFIVMEYLAAARSNEAHRRSAAFFRELGYESFLINEQGALAPVADIEASLGAQHLDSDNIVFRKK